MGQFSEPRVYLTLQFQLANHERRSKKSGALKAKTENVAGMLTSLASTLMKDAAALLAKLLAYLASVSGIGHHSRESVQSGASLQLMVLTIRTVSSCVPWRGHS